MTEVGCWRGGPGSGREQAHSPVGVGSLDVSGHPYKWKSSRVVVTLPVQVKTRGPPFETRTLPCPDQ